MRKMIVGMKMSIDGKIEGSQGFADWVDAWSEDYGLSAEIDACLLGGAMYPGYEQYWTAIANNAPNEPLPMTGKQPLPAELVWSGFAAKTIHYVLSNQMTSAQWPNTKILRSINEVATLKKQPGKNIYLMGGAQITASLIDAGLVNQIRLIVYPLLAGPGKALFALTDKRHLLVLREVKPLSQGLVSLTYDIQH